MDIRSVVRRYVVDHHLGSVDEKDITDATPLVTLGILDSLAVAELVIFLEGHFGIEFSPYDFDRRSLESIERIEELVRAKLASKGKDDPETRTRDQGPDGADR